MSSTLLKKKQLSRGKKRGLLSIYDDGRGEPDRILDCGSGTYAEYEQSLSPLGEGLYSELVKTKDDDALLVIRDKDGRLKFGGERFCSVDQFDHGVSYVKKGKRPMRLYEYQRRWCSPGRRLGSGKLSRRQRGCRYGKANLDCR